MLNFSKFAVLVALLLGTALTVPSIANPAKTQAIDPQIEQAVKTYHVRPDYKGPNLLKVRRVVVAGPYALASWSLGEGGGQSALAKRSGQWRVLQMGGGALGMSDLVRSGIPTNYAKALLRSSQ